MKEMSLLNVVLLNSNLDWLNPENERQKRIGRIADFMKNSFSQNSKDHTGQAVNDLPTIVKRKLNDTADLRGNRRGGFCV